MKERGETKDKEFRYTLRQVLDLSQNEDGGFNHAYKWVLNTFMGPMLGMNYWDERKVAIPLSEIITNLDEAFLLVSLENSWCWEAWKTV